MLAGVSGPASAASPQPSVSLTATEPMGVARRGEPTRTSVPFGRGQLHDDSSLWVADLQGRPVPSQPTVLERWPDGSVRWVAMDFLADAPAHGTSSYTLHTDGPRAAPAGTGGGLHVEVADDGPVIAAGTTRVRVRDGHDGVVVETASANTLSRQLIPLPSVDAGSALRATRAPEVKVVAHGPVRAELLFTGTTAAGMQFEARLAAFAGLRALRLQYTLTNTADVASTSPWRRLTIDLPGSFATGVVGVDGRSRPLAALTPRREVRQLESDLALLDGTRDGTHLDGWAHAESADRRLTVVVPELWQQFPAGFRLAADLLQVDLLAAPEEPLAFGVGAAKTFEAWIAWDGDAATAAELSTRLQHPLAPQPPAAWIVASRALPNAVATTDPVTRTAMARLTTAIAHYVARNAKEAWDDGPPIPCDRRTRERRRVGAFGALNWGDWNFPHYRDQSEGCDAWGNLEYDLPQVLGLAWASTGDALAASQFVAAARHYRDVDIIHHMPAHPDWVGMNHPHKMSHFAVEAPNEIDLGHTWVEGLITHYRLTGEVRSLAAARGIADVLAMRLDKAGNPRQFGWPLIALLAVYDATGERRYLDAARGYAASAMDRIDPTPAAGDWKVGILADGLAYFDAASGDARTRRWLLTYTDAWLAQREKFPDARYALPLGYLASVTGSDVYRRAALDEAEHLTIGEWGKTLAANGRTLLRLLGPLSSGAPAAPIPAPAVGKLRGANPPGPKPPAGFSQPAPFAPPPPLGAVPRRSSRSR